MTGCRLALDPTIASLADFAASMGAPQPVRVVRLATGELVFATDPRFIASQAAMFLAMCSMLVASMNAPALAPTIAPTPAQQRGARSLAIREGVAPRPRRATAADRQRAEAAKWGWA
jgi:hypothetical protein